MLLGSQHQWCIGATDLHIVLDTSDGVPEFPRNQPVMAIVRILGVILITVAAQVVLGPPTFVGAFQLGGLQNDMAPLTEAADVVVLERMTMILG